MMSDDIYYMLLKQNKITSFIYHNWAQSIIISVSYLDQFKRKTLVKDAVDLSASWELCGADLGPSKHKGTEISIHALHHAEE